MYPFIWRPSDGVRHATKSTEVADGAAFRALCGAECAAADLSEQAWLWATCPECNASAHKLAHEQTALVLP
ncbi:zinc finger protein [Saccharopolyspora griseoalba]|uniref:Zinc finger protein n=1 Tax=Saccharopolyspora griseoalba TaxID=1431848 RepID=A0ABW2LTM9_9PSEU